ncbi:MAG: MATE family efflux transporter [Clostridiales bacterium]|nr:MATE family efflux transporter [Clostridiales bacterium]
MSKTRLDIPMLGVIFSLAWPTMLQELMQTAVQYIDTAMVGSLGTQATAAVGATGTVSWLVNGTVSALGVGFLACISQAMGAGAQERAKRAAAQSALVALIFGTVLTVLTTTLSSSIVRWMQVAPVIRDAATQYFRILYLPMLFRTMNILFSMVLRAVGDSRTPMQVGLRVNCLNVLLNTLLIYPARTVHLMGISFPMWGAGWGINGAAAASAIAYTYGGISMAVRLWQHPLISPRGQRFTPDLQVLKPCLKVAIPNMFQRFGTSLGYVAFASMINALGDVSAAAHTVANTVESLFYIPGWGMQTAAAALAGNAYGARDGRKLRSLGRTFLPLEVGLMLFSGGMLFLFAPQLVGLFTRDPEVTKLSVTVLRMVAVSEPFYGVPIVLEGLMQGVGKTMVPFLFNIAGMWGVRIFGTFLCTRLLGMGLVSAWGCMVGHNLLLFVLFTVYYAAGKALPELKDGDTTEAL